MKKAYIIARRLESGGSIRVGLNEDGEPVYTEKVEDACFFLKQWDARKYMKYCKNNMTTYTGQKDWFVEGV